MSLSSNFYSSAEPRVGRAFLPLGVVRDLLLEKMEGGTRLLKDGRTSFVDSVRNVRLVREAFPDVPIEFSESALHLSQLNIADWERGRKYVSKTQPFGPYQLQAFEAARDKQFFGLFMDPGTGKTKVAIDVAGTHFARGLITGVLVITFKGVHAQWVGTAPDSPLPKHLGAIGGVPVPYVAHAWDGKTVLPFGSAPPQPGTMEWYATTYPGIDTGLGRKATSAFMQRHKGKLMVIVDESHGIANIKSRRTENCIAIGLKASVRLALTGSPVAKSPEDEWSQMQFLSESIFEHRYVTTFRKEYGTLVKGEVVEWRNLDQFKAIVAPHVFRVTKQQALGLPEQVWDNFYYDLSKEQRRHYDELKRNFLTQVTKGGEIVTVQNAAVLITRLQQIACGVLVDEDGTRYPLENTRAEALMDLLTEYEGRKVIVWCRFTEDVRNAAMACSTFGSVGMMYGATKDEERKDVLARFIRGDLRFLVANPTVLGIGTDGLQDVCWDAIYYSNSFNAVERWQSEDRIHRIGTTNKVLYRDIVARNTVDLKVLRNLREKKELANYLLDDFVELLQ